MRLIGGQLETEGQVEVCIDGVWGNICDYQWGHDDASVVCNQLGYAPDGKKCGKLCYLRHFANIHLKLRCCWTVQ